MEEIYLDTNFLLIPIQFKVDIFEEIERICHFPKKICVLKESIDELNKIVLTQKGLDKAAARIALQIIDKKVKQKSLNITAFSKELKVDDILVELAKSGAIIATQDKELKKRIKEKDGKIIILKSKGYLQLI
jgi:uncharacterized protein